MKMGIVSAFFAVACLSCSASPAEAQSNSSLPFLSREALSKLSFSQQKPAGVALGDFTSATLSGDQKNRPLYEPWVLGNIEVLKERVAEAGVLLPPQEALGQSRCAHIEMIPAPRVDEKIIAPVPLRALTSKMPQLEGLQACPSDFRDALAPRSVPLGRFGPLGPLPPNLVLPPSGIRP